MSDHSPSDESKSDRKTASSENDLPQHSGDAARAARRLKRVAPVAGESKLSRISRARRANKGPVKHPRDLLGVSLADGRYVVKAPLGKGSMAYVFRASDARLQTDVVLKVPKPEKVNTADFRERFQRESQLLIRFSHPHVVKVLDVGEYSELPYVVMQLLEGGSLSDRIAREADENGCMTPESLKTWVREVARALDFCYRKGMVHRDVKPANILFDEDNNAYVGDFGLSKIMCGEHTELSSDETAAGVVLGTPNYISPEVVQGKDYDGRSDQYSLGITIYHVLTGGPPMQGNTATMTMLNQTQKVLPLLSDVRSDIPRPLAVAVRKAIEKDPAKRFNTCVEFSEAVIEGLRFSPVISTSSNSSASMPGKASGRPVASISGSSASLTSTAKAGDGKKRSASSSTRKERRAVDPTGGSSKSSIRKNPKRRKATTNRSSRSSQRRMNSASSSLALDVDLDWFDMDTSGEHSSVRSSSSSRSSSKTSSRRRALKAEASKGKLVNVFGQQLHPTVLVGLAFFSAVCIVMFVWSPWAPEEVNPELVAGQYYPTAQSERERSQKQLAVSRLNSKETDGNSNSEQRHVDTAQGSSLSLGSDAKADQSTTTAAVTEPDSSSSDELLQAAADPSQGEVDAEKTSVYAAIQQDPMPLFSVPSGVVTLFGDSTAKVFVTGRTIRSRDTAAQNTLLSGRYSADPLTTLSSDGKWFAATVTDRVDRDFVVRVWDTETGAIGFEVKGDGRRRIRNIFLSGQFLYLETDRATQLQVWNLETKRQQGILTLPSNRLRSQRMAITKDGSALAAIVGDEFAVVDGRTGAVMTSLEAPLPPAVQVAMADATTKLSRVNTQDLVHSTQVLQFSDDQLQLAALRSLPTPTLMVWNEAGELQYDLPFGVSSNSCQPKDIHWFEDRSAWLVNGSVVDAKYRRVVVSVLHDDDQIATTGLQDDDHLLTSLRRDSGQVYCRRIPWLQIEASLQSMSDDERALLKPGGTVSVSVDVADGNGMGIVLRPLLEKSLHKKLRTEQIEVAKGAGLTFHLKNRNVPHRDAPVTVLQLVEGENDRVIWYAVVGPSLELDSDDFVAQRSIAQQIGERISTLAIPYYIPADSTQIMLPYCIDQ